MRRPVRIIRTLTGGRKRSSAAPSIELGAVVDLGGGNYRRTLTITGATGGTFRFTYTAQPNSGTVPFNPTTTQIANAINAMNDDWGLIASPVTGTGPWQINFDTSACSALGVDGTSLT